MITWKLRELKESYERISGEPLSYRKIATGSGISNSTVSKILNEQTRIVDFDVVDKLLAYFSKLMSRQLGITDLLHYVPDEPSRK